MNPLLADALAAHGGLERWQGVASITAHGAFRGLLRFRFPGNRLSNLSVTVQLADQHTVLHGFPREDQRAVFDRGDVRLETNAGDPIAARTDARSVFSGLSGLRRNLRWDALDAAYFAGYAFWNYLSTPLLLTRPGVTTIDGGAWMEQGERWRRIEVRFPPDIHTHSRQQTFYIDAAGLVRRHDYVAEPVGRWARAIHYCDSHRYFDGLVIPTRRRVHPRGPGGRPLPHPILVALEIDKIEIETRPLTERPDGPQIGL